MTRGGKFQRARRDQWLSMAASEGVTVAPGAANWEVRDAIQAARDARQLAASPPDRRVTFAEPAQAALLQARALALAAAARTEALAAAQAEAGPPPLEAVEAVEEAFRASCNHRDPSSTVAPAPMLSSFATPFCTAESQVDAAIKLCRKIAEEGHCVAVQPLPAASLPPAVPAPRLREAAACAVAPALQYTAPELLWANLGGAFDGMAALEQKSVATLELQKAHAADLYSTIMLPGGISKKPADTTSDDTTHDPCGVLHSNENAAPAGAFSTISSIWSETKSGVFANKSLPADLGVSICRVAGDAHALAPGPAQWLLLPAAAPTEAIPLSQRDTAQAMLAASKAGDVRALTEALSRGAAMVIDARGEDGATALQWAAHLGYTHVALTLLSVGADPLAANTSKRHQGDNAAHFAAARGQHCIFAALAPSGALNAAGRHGEQPIFRAAHNGHTDTIMELARLGVDVNARAAGCPSEACTPLVCAAAAGQPRTVAALLSVGANALALVRSKKGVLETAEAAARRVAASPRSRPELRSGCTEAAALLAAFAPAAAAHASSPAAVALAPAAPREHRAAGPTPGMRWRAAGLGLALGMGASASAGAGAGMGACAGLVGVPGTATEAACFNGSSVGTNAAAACPSPAQAPVRRSKFGWHDARAHSSGAGWASVRFGD
jgi:hypothetical protein